MAMDDRKARVLRAVVEENIRTGQPVSSQAVLDCSGLEVSPATVRNDLAALESDGYLKQPHTSAGRVPTERAFRFYVDTADPTRLKAKTRDRIEGFFTSFHRELRLLLQETSELLTDITSYPAVVVGPGFQGEIVHSVSLVRLASEVLLLVVVTEAGRVTQELVKVPRRLDDGEIDELEAFVASHLVGKTIEEARSLAQVEPRQLPAAVEVVESVAEAAKRAEDESRELYVGGTSSLASIWQDLTKLHGVLELIERQSRLIALLDAAAEGTHVLIGPEVGEALDLSVVSTSFGKEPRAGGRVAVLGPMRMDYRRTIRVVEEVGEGLSDKVDR